MASSMGRCCVSLPSGSRLTNVDLTSPANIVSSRHTRRYAAYLSCRAIDTLNEPDSSTLSQASTKRRCGISLAYLPTISARPVVSTRECAHKSTGFPSSRSLQDRPSLRTPKVRPYKARDKERISPYSTCGVTVTPNHRTPQLDTPRYCSIVKVPTAP